MDEALRYTFRELNYQRALTRRWAVYTVLLGTYAYFLFREQQRLRKELETLKQQANPTTN